MIFANARTAQLSPQSSSFPPPPGQPRAHYGRRQLRGTDNNFAPPPLPFIVVATAPKRPPPYRSTAATAAAAAAQHDDDDEDGQQGCPRPPTHRYVASFRRRRRRRHRISTEIDGKTATPPYTYRVPIYLYKYFTCRHWLYACGGNVLFGRSRIQNHPLSRHRNTYLYSHHHEGFLSKPMISPRSLHALTCWPDARTAMSDCRTLYVRTTAR